MTLQTQIKETAEGELYIDIPEQLTWHEHDQIQLTIMTDLDTDQPAILIVNVSDRKRSAVAELTENIQVI